NTPDQARHARFVDIRSNAIGVGVAARAEIGLIRLRQRLRRTKASSAHEESAVHIEHVSSDITCHWRRQEQRRIDNLARFTQAAEWNLFDEILRHFLRHVLAHSYIKESRRNGVYGYILPCKLAC